MKLFSFAAKAALSALVVFGVSVSANAGALVEYSFDHSSTHPTTIAPETMASAFNKGVGGDFAGGKFAFAESAAASEVNAPFVTLSLGTLTGKKLQLESLEFDAAFMGANGQGMLGARFLGQGGNFETAITTTQFPNFSTYSIALSGVSILNDTLKLYVYDNDGGATARIRIDNIRLNGSVVADVPHAPEPSTLALVGLGAFGFGAAKLRQRRKNRLNVA